MVSWQSYGNPIPRKMIFILKSDCSLNVLRWLVVFSTLNQYLPQRWLNSQWKYALQKFISQSIYELIIEIFWKRQMWNLSVSLWEQVYMTGTFETIATEPRASEVCHLMTIPWATVLVVCFPVIMSPNGHSLSYCYGNFSCHYVT